MIASNFLFTYCTEELMNKQFQCHSQRMKKRMTQSKVIVSFYTLDRKK